MQEMGHGKLGPSGTELPDLQQPAASSGRRLRSRNWKLILLSLLALALVLASAISAILFTGLRTRASGGSRGRHPSQAISRTCAKARYPDLCVNSLLDFPGSMAASEQDLVHISFNMTLQHFDKALYWSSSMGYLEMEPIERSAYEDCIELLDASVDVLSRSLSTIGGGSGSPVAAAEDVVTWLSTVLDEDEQKMDLLRSNAIRTGRKRMRKERERKAYHKQTRKERERGWENVFFL